MQPQGLPNARTSRDPEEAPANPQAPEERASLSVLPQTVLQKQRWLLCSLVGGGQATLQMTVKGQQAGRGLVPWAGVAARLGESEGADATQGASLLVEAAIQDTEHAKCGDIAASTYRPEHEFKLPIYLLSNCFTNKQPQRGRKSLVWYLSVFVVLHRRDV